MSRMRALSVLQRLHDLKLKEKASELTELQTRLARVSAARGELDHKRVYETRVEMVEAMPYIPAFLAHMRSEDRKLEAAERALEGHVERVRGQVMEHFRDLKSTAKLQDIIARRTREAEEARETGERDELTIISHAKTMRG
ncbi:hypothetical protein ACEUZ9_004661 [Paracoccus litorisediminis]|uniref:hypothetical protein n=1 Tax=Paracoccus litorisediminis TaxID=2006130 RepID=UPI00372FF0EA